MYSLGTSAHQETSESIASRSLQPSERKLAQDSRTPYEVLGTQALVVIFKTIHTHAFIEQMFKSLV